MSCAGIRKRMMTTLHSNAYKPSVFYRVFTRSSKHWAASWTFYGN